VFSVGSTFAKMLFVVSTFKSNVVCCIHKKNIWSIIFKEVNNEHAYLQKTQTYSEGWRLSSSFKKIKKIIIIINYFRKI
jgi:hypothetical protein